MQQAELMEILPELKAKVEDYNRYGTTQPTTQDIKIYECRQHNLMILKAEKERWQRIREARLYNLEIKAKEEEEESIKLLELLKKNKELLSTIR